MVFEEIYERIREEHSKTDNETIVIGVGGGVASGKSSFFAEFSHFLKEKKDISSLSWEIDLYQEPRLKKKRIIDALLKESPKEDISEIIGGVYFKHYNYDLAIKHLVMLKNREDIPDIHLYQRQTGEWDNLVSQSFDKKGPLWIIYNGVFILHKDIRELLDRIIFLCSNKEVRFKRAVDRALNQRKPYFLERENFDGLDDFIRRYEEKNLRRNSDIVIDNNNYLNRKIISPLEKLSL